MKSCVLIALALACAAEAFVHRGHDLYPNMEVGDFEVGATGFGNIGVDECSQAIERCMTPMFGYLTKFSKKYDVTHSSETTFTKATFDNVCTDFTPVKHCLEQTRKTCSASPELTKYLMALSKMVDYICSTKGKTTMMTLTHSRCVKNSVKLNEYGHALLACKVNFDTKAQQVMRNTWNPDTPTSSKDHTKTCPHIDELKSCLKHKTMTKCGENFGKFINDVYTTVAEVILSDASCVKKTENAYHFLTRIVPHVQAVLTHTHGSFHHDRV